MGLGAPRGFGKSEDGSSPVWDNFDLVEWIAAQPWRTGKVGMVGLSAFAMAQGPPRSCSPRRIGSSRTVAHSLFHNQRYPSHRLLPIIAQTGE